MIQQLGTPICWDAQAKWLDLPISNLPADALKVRRRIRAGMPAVAYVRTRDRTAAWMLYPDGENAVRLGHVMGANSRM